MTRNQFALALAMALAVPPAAARAEILARIRFEATDLANNPISSIDVGEDFRLRALVKDLRGPLAANGVFAAFLYGDYDESLVSTIATPGPGADPGIVFDSFFTIVRSGELSTPGEITAAGAASGSLTAPGLAEQFLFHVQFQADSAGLATFTPSFDDTLGHDVVLYLIDNPISEDQILFESDSLTIVPEPSALVLAAVAVVALACCGRRRGARRRPISPL
jgi:hypothetical protein